MIDVKDLRIGNLINSPNGIITVTSIESEFKEVKDGECTVNDYNISELDGISLTPERLSKAGFKQLPHFTVQNSWFLNIGRDRVISIACVGTTNEMVFINEEVPPEVKNIIVARNYDFDGKTYLHHIQNIVNFLTGTELLINLNTEKA